jgi:Tol biopolymer transport system component
MTSDGLEIAFFSGATSGTQVFSIGADGGNRRQRTFDEAALNTLPVWSADDAWLYYYRNRSLYRLPRDGDRSEEVLADFHWSLQHWLIAHGDRIAFRVRNVVPEQRRTVVLDLVEGSEVDLPLTFSPTQWSRDGLTILGFSQEPDTRGQIFLCPVSAEACRVLADADGPILGTEPRWSMDETRVFFRRPAGRANHNTLWVADADGSDVRMLFEFGPFDVELSDSYFGVTDDDQIVWNQYDTADTEEIWVAGAGD